MTTHFIRNLMLIKNIKVTLGKNEREKGFRSKCNWYSATEFYLAEAC